MVQKRSRGWGKRGGSPSVLLKASTGTVSHYLSMMRSVWELPAGAVAYLSTFGGSGEGEENNDKIRMAEKVGD